MGCNCRDAKVSVVTRQIGNHANPEFFEMSRNAKISIPVGVKLFANEIICFLGALSNIVNCISGSNSIK
jgi:hypothetical protein